MDCNNRRGLYSTWKGRERGGRRVTPLRCGKKYNSLTSKRREKTLPFRLLFHFKQPDCSLIFSLSHSHRIEGCFDTKIEVQKDGREVAKRLILADQRKRCCSRKKAVLKRHSQDFLSLLLGCHIQFSSVSLID